MVDALDNLFFSEIEAKVLELDAIGRDYKAGVIALVIPITKEGAARYRLLRPGMSKGDLLNVLSAAYDWAVRQIENDSRLKE